jgi:ABC-type branched-subunit amino acid transport system permease subunit
MAQTRRRRQTKHRGNAAGVVESRGRTGRKPTTAEKTGKAGSGESAKEKRLERLERAPTWRGAFYRAMAAAVLMLLLSLLVLKLKNPNQAIALFPIVLIAYIPISYYTDMWLYKRRMASKAKQRGGGAAK